MLGSFAVAVGARRAVRAPLAASPRAGGRPRARCASASFRSRAWPPRGPGWASTPTCCEHPVAQSAWGYDVLGPAWRWCRARWWRRSSPPAWDRWRSGSATAVLVVPGALVWAGGYSGTTRRSAWSPPSRPSGCRASCSSGSAWAPPPAARRRRPGRRSGRPVRHGVGAVQRAAARRDARHRGPGLIVGNPDGPGVVEALRDGWLLSIVAFVLVALVALPVGKVAARHEAEDVDHGEPLLLLPDPRDMPAEAPRSGASIGLDDVPLVAALSEQARVALAAASRTVQLDAGAWLFRENDPPGRRTCSRSGRLEVMQGTRLVRTLTPGAVVGELALLTSEPRSAGVRARRDSTLLEVPRSAWDGLLSRDQSATRTVLRQVAGQLRTAGSRPPVDRPARPHVVAVVGLHTGSGCDGRPAPQGPARHPPVGGRPRRGRQRGPGQSRGGRRAGRPRRRRCRTRRRRGVAGVLPAAVGRRRPGGQGRHRRTRRRARPRPAAGPGGARRGRCTGGPGRLGGAAPTPGG